MGRSCPSQRAQPFGGKTKLMIRTSDKNGSAISSLPPFLELVGLRSPAVAASKYNSISSRLRLRSRERARRGIEVVAADDQRPTRASRILRGGVRRSLRRAGR